METHHSHPEPARPLEGRPAPDRQPLARGRSEPRLHPLAFLASGWRHRRLVRRLAWRHIESRYRGSVLGLLWSLLHPLLLLGIYTFVFSVVFQVKWGRAEGGNTEFALFLFSGMILYAIFAENVNEAPNLLRSHQIFIKQLVFPSEILPWVSLAASFFTFALSAVILTAFHLLVRGLPPWTWVYLPLVIVPLALLSLGASWLLSSLGVFLEDISQVVGLATTALLFLSPIFYSPDRIPDAWRELYLLNPIATILIASKNVLFRGSAPDWAALGTVTAAGWGAAWLGWIWFVKTRKSFADVL